MKQADSEIQQAVLREQDGRVTLSGRVRSWTEKNAVIGAAKGTPGVRSVEDQLRIDPYSS
jgi:osmotically-inducible protein OsmY